MTKNRDIRMLVVVLSMVSAFPVRAIEFDIDHYRASWADQRAYKVGDIVTILIAENAKASSSAGIDADNRHKIGVSNDFRGEQFNLDAGLRSEMANDASTSRRGSISATITARIIGIDPYGLLKVQGSQYVTVNGEEQQITLSGFIRPDDLSPQNAIISSRIESAQIELSGIGEVNDNRKPSIFRSLFRWLGF
ncbi:flagellar basal body L-ring protein FlgH [Photobacterium sp. CCB-ST2H9]|uniref:flagellar basal body L-ring protein FlgH n=1 Tax=Photobacterium sp. CCB-ST2H9 TaxID=2912855 RepID=UPI0020053675|nr:flagellar basal body L-ring protein FlgH [Photobacterium sp. CCB-ST2H9]UTM58466.1 flagellar basal body L-ring protein FlgH [Photobacterium sp. CCB-ST2H9]